MYLVLGSCRAFEAVFHSKNNYCPLASQYNFSNRCGYLGRGWSSLEHLHLLRLINGTKPIKNYRGVEVDAESFEKSLRWTQGEWKNITGVIMEISSIKYFKKDGHLFHNLPKKFWKRPFQQFKLSESEMMETLNEIVKILHGKRIIFVNHFLHTKVPNRLLIDSCLQKMKSDNVLVITPSDLWDEKTENLYLRDPVHYKKGIRRKIAKYFDNCIKSHFKDT